MSHVISAIILGVASISEVKTFRFREAKQAEPGHTASWRRKCEWSSIMKSEGFGAGGQRGFESFTNRFIIVSSSAGRLPSWSLNFFISEVRVAPSTTSGAPRCEHSFRRVESAQCITVNVLPSEPPPPRNLSALSHLAPL